MINAGLVSYSEYLVSSYGRQSDDILGYYDQKVKDPNVALMLAELEFSLENEATFTLLDFFERRTGRLYFHISSINP